MFFFPVAKRIIYERALATIKNYGRKIKYLKKKTGKVLPYLVRMVFAQVKKTSFRKREATFSKKI